MKLSELSKALSHALRHEPWLYELELDDQGSASLDAVLCALRKERPEWRTLTRVCVEQAVGSSPKRRHEIVGDRVRALYGHSLPGRLLRERAAPPPVLFHGTDPETARVIVSSDGLRPMSRQYVHLSLDLAMAREVGRRKSKAPILIEVDAGAASEVDVAFYQGNEQVWLADHVPSRFLRIVQ